MQKNDQIIGLYSKDIFIDIFVANNFFDFIWNVVSLQSMSHYYYLHTKLFDELLLICTHQNLLQKPHPLQCLVYYFVKKQL